MRSACPLAPLPHILTQNVIGMHAKSWWCNFPPRASLALMVQMALARVCGAPLALPGPNPSFWGWCGVSGPPKSAFFWFWVMASSMDCQELRRGGCASKRRAREAPGLETTRKGRVGIGPGMQHLPLAPMHASMSMLALECCRQAVGTAPNERQTSARAAQRPSGWFWASSLEVWASSVAFVAA